MKKLLKVLTVVFCVTILFATTNTTVKALEEPIILKGIHISIDVPTCGTITYDPITDRLINPPTGTILSDEIKDWTQIIDEGDWTTTEYFDNPHVIEGDETYLGTIYFFVYGNYVIDEDYINSHPEAVIVDNGTSYEGSFNLEDVGNGVYKLSVPFSTIAKHDLASDGKCNGCGEQFDPLAPNPDPNPEKPDGNENPSAKMNNMLNSLIKNAAGKNEKTVIYFKDYTGNDAISIDVFNLLAENPNVVLVLDYTFFDEDTQKDIHVHAVINQAILSKIVKSDIKLFGPACLSGFVQYYNDLPADIKNQNY